MICGIIAILSQQVFSSTANKCSQCHSELIVVTSTSEKHEGAMFVQTTTSYKCSNTSCQNEIDKQTQKRLKLKEEKDNSDAKRLESKKQGSAAKIR